MFRVGIVGCGGIAQVHGAVLEALDRAFAAAGEEAVVLGEVVEGSEGVILC